MIGAHRKIYVLLGNPVGHSLSPLMHATAFREMGVHALYIPFCADNAEEAVRDIQTLGIEGASVTLPFKTSIMPHLDEVDESARRIGAVNTIVRRQGRLVGYNTDWIGLVRSLGGSTDIRDSRFAILGAGGAGRAAVFGILQEGGMPLVVNRTPEKGRALAREFGCRFHPFPDMATLKADGLIQTTPVGMWPDTEATPAAREHLGRFKLVMDIIYNPLRTRLLREAAEAGCAVVDGLEMFVRQGAEQIRLWTGREPPVGLMRKVVWDRLKKAENEDRADKES